MTLATSTLQVDNERVRVTLYSFFARDETGFHTHQMDYVIIPLCDGTLHIADDDGNINDAQLTKGESYFRKAGIAHNVINASDNALSFIEVELK